MKMSRRMAIQILPLFSAAMLAPSGSELASQTTLFTYQGRVLDHGTNFTGTGLFKFALVTSSNISSQATAIATLTGKFVTSCTVTYGGSGYVTAPAVTFSEGGGSGATATAVISAGVVTSITVDNAGSGYTTPPVVTIAALGAHISSTTYWSNDGTSTAGSQPAAAVSVNVINGLFTVVLGDTTVGNMGAIPAALFTQPGLQLRIWLSDGVNGFAALSPDQNLTPMPYAAFANAAENLVYANGVQLTSDRHAKEHFTAVNPTEVLAKVEALPVTAWGYTDCPAERHMGPTAQDFHAAFGLNGSDDTHISVGDEGGVALAAIQGLNQKLKEKEAEIQKLQARLERLERLLSEGGGGVK